MATVDELGDKIRDYIIHPRLQHSLLQNLARWNVLCSSLDVIGDTELAIGAYQHLDDTEDDGVRYLVLYGILQVLFVQQDAAKHILESLDIASPEADADLTYVREIRNRAIGHPTKRDRSPQTSHFIARMSLHTRGFLLMTSDEHGTNVTTEVSIPDLLRRQQTSLP